MSESEGGLHEVKRAEGALSNAYYLDYVLNNFADQAELPRSEFDDVRAIARGQETSTFVISELLEDMYQVSGLTRGTFVLLIPMRVDPKMSQEGGGFRITAEVNGRTGVVVDWGLNMGEDRSKMARITPLVVAPVKKRLKIVTPALSTWKLERRPIRRNFSLIEGGKK